MLEQLENIYSSSLTSLAEAGSTADLESWYKETLGRKGQVILMTRQVGQLAPEDRPVFGKRVNAIKGELETAYRDKSSALQAAELEAEMAADSLDVTLPGRRQWRAGQQWRRSR